MKTERDAGLQEVMSNLASDLRSNADIVERSKRQGEKNFAGEMRLFADICASWAKAYERGIGE